MSIKYFSDIQLADNNEAIFGTGSDLKIKHDGSDSLIRNFTGDLYLRNLADNKDIIFQGDDGGNNTITALTLDISDAGKAIFNAGANFSNTVTIITGGPKLNLQDNTDDDDQQINFVNNSGVTDYMIRTSDPTSGGGGDGFYIGSVQSDGEVALFTHNTTALTLDTSQNATFAADITCGDDLFMPSGGVINFNSGDVTLTHSSNTLTVAGGNLSLAGFVLDGNTITGVDDSGEFTDNDSHIMTSAGINDRFLALIGGTMTGNITVDEADDVLFTNATNDSYSMSSTETKLNAMPFPLDFHDVLAFGHNYTITQEISTDGTNFSSMTLEGGVFDLRTDNSVRVIDGSLSTEEQATRYTFTNVAYVSAQFLKICFTHQSSAADVTVTVDTSSDGFSSDSTQRHTSTVSSASAKTVYFYLDGHSGDTHMRVTLDKGNNTDNKNVLVSSIQLLTRRHGDQGQGPEYNVPYAYDYDRNITLYGTVLGTSAKFGRDADNLLDFTVDNEITFRANASDEMVLNGSTLSPHASDGLALGTSSLMWSDLFLASGGVINFNNGDMTITHNSNQLTIGGGKTTINSLELAAADHVIEDGANILDENDETLFTFSSGVVSTGGNFQTGGTITTPSDIIHTGDTDTKISFGTNTVTVTAGNVNAVVASQEGASITKRKFAKTGNTDGTADGDIVYLGGTTSMTTGAIYHYKSDGTWELADADAASTCDGLLGVALGSSSDDNGVLLRGMVTLDHDPGAVGDVLFLSTTAGDATATAPSGNGDIVRVIGYCLDASNGQIFFNPDGTFVEVTA